MKDYVTAVLTSMAEKDSSILRLTFKTDESGTPSKAVRESLRLLLAMEYNAQIVMDLEAIGALENVRVKKSWESLPTRSIVIRTTGTFKKENFADALSEALENIELLQERRKTPRE